MPSLPIGKPGKELWFDFPAGWTVVEFDEDKANGRPPGYYRRTIISEGVQSVRGVDIVARPPAPSERLLLIEVKDDRERTIAPHLRHEELRTTVLQKVLGTLAGLVIAERTWEESLLRLACLSEKPTIEVVLFLEEPPLPVTPDVGSRRALRRLVNNTYQSDLEQRLTAKLVTWAMPFYLFNLTANPPTEWAVRGAVGPLPPASIPQS